VGGAGSPLLNVGDFHNENTLNNVAFVCIMSRYPTSIADYTRLSAGMLPVFRVGVVGKIILRPLIWLLEIVVPALVLAPFDSPLLIIELVLFLHCPFHVDCGVIYVFV